MVPIHYESSTDQLFKAAYCLLNRAQTHGSCTRLFLLKLNNPGALVKFNQAL